MADPIRVRIALTREDAEAGRSSVRGDLEIAATSRRREVDDDGHAEVVLPVPISVTVTAGGELPIVSLAQDDGVTWARTVIERVDDGRGRRTTFTVSDVTRDPDPEALWDVDYADLTLLDPKTLEPIDHHLTVGEAITAETTARQTADAELAADIATKADTDNTVTPAQVADVLREGDRPGMLDRANHTGTQDTSTISGLESVVAAIVDAGLESLVADAPAALDTLGEVADALQGNPDIITELLAAVGARVALAGDQTVSGIKTFTDAPVVPDNSFALAKVAGLVAALAVRPTSTTVQQIVTLTQTEYDALTPGPDPATLYLVTDD